MCTGELPLEIIRMKAEGVDISLNGNKGFTLPSTIGELSDCTVPAIQHDSHEHLLFSLVLIDHSCDVCGCTISGQAWRCRNGCDYDVCSSCAFDSNVQNVSITTLDLSNCSLQGASVAPGLSASTDR